MKVNTKLFLFTLFSLIGLDQVTKYFFYKQINFGGVFGVGQGWSWVLLMAASLFVVLFFFLNSSNKFEKWGLVIIMSSGISNMTDRVIMGGVRDFIYWPTLDVYGNFADLMLFVGVCLVVWSYFMTSRVQ
ncbi:signal peptidase II [Patescibacteria group bacterium]